MSNLVIKMSIVSTTFFDFVTFLNMKFTDYISFGHQPVDFSDFVHFRTHYQVKKGLKFFNNDKCKQKDLNLNSLIFFPFD